MDRRYGNLARAQPDGPERVDPQVPQRGESAWRRHARSRPWRFVALSRKKMMARLGSLGTRPVSHPDRLHVGDHGWRRSASRQTSIPVVEGATENTVVKALIDNLLASSPIAAAAVIVDGTLEKGTQADSAIRNTIGEAAAIASSTAAPGARRQGRRSRYGRQPQGTPACPFLPRPR